MPSFRNANPQSFPILGCSGVTRGADWPDDTLQGGETRRKKILSANLQRILDKRGWTGKKRCGVSFFREKVGATPSVAAPGDTHPSDITDGLINMTTIKLLVTVRPRTLMTKRSHERKMMTTLSFTT